jgi:hypothetical protein
MDGHDRDRRKIRARRNVRPAIPDAGALQLPASPAQHAVTEFKWASDRHSQPVGTVPASSANRTNTGPLAASTPDRHSRAGSNQSAAATAADFSGANEFKWISDYVDDADGALSRCWSLKVRNGVCLCLQFLLHPVLNSLWTASGYPHGVLVFCRHSQVPASHHLQVPPSFELQVGSLKGRSNSSRSNRHVLREPLHLARQVGSHVGAVHSSSSNSSSNNSSASYSSMSTRLTRCKMHCSHRQQRGQLLQLPSVLVLEQQLLLGTG